MHIIEGLDKVKYHVFVPQYLNSFPHTDSLMPLQQTTFGNIVTNGEIAQYKHFFLLSQNVQLFSIIKLSFIEIFQMFAYMISKLSAADLLYVGKG